MDTQSLFKYRICVQHFESIQRQMEQMGKQMVSLPHQLAQAPQESKADIVNEWSNLLCFLGNSSQSNLKVLSSLIEVCAESIISEVEKQIQLPGNPNTARPMGDHPLQEESPIVGQILATTDPTLEEIGKQLVHPDVPSFRAEMPLSAPHRQVQEQSARPDSNLSNARYEHQESQGHQTLDNNSRRNYSVPQQTEPAMKGLDSSVLGEVFLPTSDHTRLEDVMVVPETQRNQWNPRVAQVSDKEGREWAMLMAKSRDDKFKPSQETLVDVTAPPPPFRMNPENPENLETHNHNVPHLITHGAPAVYSQMSLRPQNDELRSQDSAVALQQINGWEWRKYGQKVLKEGDINRSYFRCAERTCPAKKISDLHLDGRLLREDLVGFHNHPQTYRATRHYGRDGQNLEKIRSAQILAQQGSQGMGEHAQENPPCDASGTVYSTLATEPGSMQEQETTTQSNSSKLVPEMNSAEPSIMPLVVGEGHFENPSFPSTEVEHKDS